MGRDRHQRPRQNIKRDIVVTPKTEGQREYLEAIEEDDLIICSGPAGTGKTIVAIGAALLLMRNNPHKYKKLILARPYVVLDGEDMGFLPGDANDKLRPFMMPLVDSMSKFVDQGTIQTMFGHGVVEFLPVAHMRGRTFSDCIVIFDEAQNSKISHMKMFLTRLGDNCKAIIEGDVKQSDLVGQDAEDNGLAWALSRLDGLDGISIVQMLDEDIVRSSIVRRIISRL